MLTVLDQEILTHSVGNCQKIVCTCDVEVICSHRLVDGMQMFGPGLLRVPQHHDYYQFIHLAELAQ